MNYRITSLWGSTNFRARSEIFLGKGLSHTLPTALTSETILTSLWHLWQDKCAIWHLLGWKVLQGMQDLSLFLEWHKSSCSCLTLGKICLDFVSVPDWQENQRNAVTFSAARVGQPLVLWGAAENQMLLFPSLPFVYCLLCNSYSPALFRCIPGTTVNLT